MLSAPLHNEYVATELPETEPDSSAARQRQSSNRITRTIRAASNDLRARYPFLAHQDALGITAFGACVIGIGATAGLFLTGTISAWLCVPAIAIFLSIVHELEHDLIHNLYFKKRKYVQNALLAFGWVLRPNTINPWLRRRLHLNHHRVSGTTEDLEERAITNGEPFGFARLVMMADGLCAIAFRLSQARGRRLKLLAFAFAGYFPLGIAYFALWYAFLGAHSAEYLGLPRLFEPNTLAALDRIVIVMILPNFVRSFCINFISSNMHYYGDVERGNVLEQTQVLNTWLLLPFQLFCFNFGATHAIHHFVAGEPFYIRQWTARVAHRVMRENGVRFNDLGTFRRANRYRHDLGPRTTLELTLLEQ